MGNEGAGIIWKLLFVVIGFVVLSVLHFISSYGVAKGIVMLVLSVLFFGALIYYFVNE